MVSRTHTSNQAITGAQKGAAGAAPEFTGVSGLPGSSGDLDRVRRDAFDFRQVDFDDAIVHLCPGLVAQNFYGQVDDSE